jgi:hypothetical protein
MPAYSFKERFIPLIKSGAKKQTIRGKRKNQAKPGDKLYLFYGMRTKFCMRILETRCTAVKSIIIYKRGSVYINGKQQNDDQREKLAIADGFENYETMLRWWKLTNELPFKGDIIYW